MQPGHCSFIANPIPWQVDVLHSRVDFQCFSKGLRKKTISNHVKPERLQCDLRKHTPTGDCSSNWIISPSRGKKYKNLWNRQIVNFLCNYIRQQSLISRLAPEKWWLEDDPFLLKRKLFMAYLKLREGRLYSFQWQKTTKVSHDWDTWRSSGQRVHREVSRSQEESLEFNTLTKRKIINQINRMFKGCILIGLTMMH